MFSYLLGMMAMIIYNQMYGVGTIVTTIDQYEKILNKVLKLPAISAVDDSIKSLAVGITLLLFFADLSAKVTEKNFSIEQFFKALLRSVTAYMFIMNSDVIVGYLIDVGQAMATDIKTQVTGYEYFIGENKEMLINGIANMKILEILSYIVPALIPWLLALISEVILQVILISRMFEITVMTIFAPLAISDIYREGTSSNGVTYIKKMLALSLQITVIILINVATSAIVSAIVGSTAATDVAALLKVSEETTVSGKVYTSESIIEFLDVITGNEDKDKVFGIMLARIGLIWSSMPLCEEITGAK